MDVRVWGVVEDRLIEVQAESAAADGGFRIDGLPENRTRTTADRVRAALINARLLEEAPPMTIRLEPVVRGLRTSELDLAIALAVLVQAGGIGANLQWILATGRLGLDGEVLAPGLGDRLSLADVAETLCHTPVVESELMFED
ncbi:MAG: magnesium chelatase domain-containing protein, partial [Actinomycetota bacterium]